MLVGDRRDGQLLGAGGLQQLLEAVGDGARRTDQLRLGAVHDQIPVLVGPHMRGDLLRGREPDGARARADAADPQAVAGGEVGGPGVVLGDDDVRGDRQVRLGQLGGGPKGLAVGVDRVQHGARAVMVGRGEPQTACPGDLGARPPRGTQDPDLHVRALAGARVRLLAVRRTVRPGQQRQDLVDLFGVVLAVGAGLLEQARDQADLGGGQQLRDVDLPGQQQAVRGPRLDAVIATAAGGPVGLQHTDGRRVTLLGRGAVHRPRPRRTRAVR